MLGDKLKKARLDCGLTQQQVADLLGIDRSSYTYYETGKSKVSTQTLRLLAVIFGIDFESFLYDEPKKLIFHSETKFKPNGLSDYPFLSNTLCADERKVLAQIRMIRYMGKEEELNRVLSKLAHPELDDGAEEEKNE